MSSHMNRREKKKACRASETLEDRELRLNARRKRDRARRTLKATIETAEEREVRLSERRQQDRVRRQAQESEKRCIHLQNLRSIQQDKLTSETKDEKASRLQVLSLNQKKRLASETEDEKASRLQALSLNKKKKLASETEDEKKARLQALSLNKKKRLASESKEKRDARLKRMRLNSQQRFASSKRRETEREDQLQNDRERSLNQGITLLNEPSIQAKIRNFHFGLANIQTPSCFTCDEKFPELNVKAMPNSDCTEFVCCKQERSDQKLLTAANNMNTGPIPSELQYTEEKLGQSEKTEYSEEFQESLNSCDKIKTWSERLIKEAEALLQPNPATRLEDLLTEKLQSYKPDHQTELDLFSKVLTDASEDLGTSSAYGVTLKNCGEAEKKVAEEWRSFCMEVVDKFVIPMKEFLEKDVADVMRERKTLDMKRLDLDAAKGRHKKVTAPEKEPSPDELLKVDEALKTAQEDFDSQLEETQKLLSAIANFQASHIRHIRAYSEAQANYYQKSAEILKVFAKQSE